MSASPAKGAGISKPTIKEQEKKRKTVFRQILETPFNVAWFELPFVNFNVKALSGSTNEYRTCRRSLQAIPLHFGAHASVLSPLSKNQSQESPPSKNTVHAPKLGSVTIGFNDTTQHLESEIRKETDRHLRVVFVARGDTSSSQLYAHFPMMAAMLPNLRLVSFAKGAEACLCEALSIKRVGVVGLMDETPGAETLFELVEAKVEKIEYPWATEGANFVPTRIKWIETIPNQKEKKRKTKNIE